MFVLVTLPKRYEPDSESDALSPVFAGEDDLGASNPARVSAAARTPSETNVATFLFDLARLDAARPVARADAVALESVLHARS